ncbi:MAG: 23S rRNA (uracil(1939)-C(5))-methyltransferase RlmD [Clostridia bacterium]|nr:23S rRNA (uracil(1939)-C(5))-methyltransferase RlmD [Clostridia bacterium]
MEIRKNEEYIVDIIDNGFEGEGIAKINNFTIFVKGAIKGEKVKILILKVNSSYAFAKILEIIAKSEYRCQEDCKSYKRCGGCDLRHIKYDKTLDIKRNMVQSLLNKTLKNQIKVNDTIGMENPFNYRNKAQYPVGIDKEGNSTFGVFANRTHDIIPIEDCKIQTKISEEIAKYILKFIQENKIKVYDEKINRGTFRHIIVKVGMKTDEVMCVLVINEEKIKNEKQLVSELKEKFPKIKTIVKNINNKNTNVILGNRNIILYGDGYIKDKLGEFTFKISPMSFYQINPIQTEKLYNLAIQKAELTGNETIFDLYCGIGTIGIFASKHVKQVYGIEIIPQAIQDAKENAKLNNIKNVEFIVGDVEFALSELIETRKIMPEVVFVDPPRKGLDNTTIQNLLKVEQKKIIYISCNPATLVRDLKTLEEKYEIKDITPVDMFPWTKHVECVAVLQLKQDM